jgi:hypothetical protein
MQRGQCAQLPPQEGHIVRYIDKTFDIEEKPSTSLYPDIAPISCTTSKLLPSISLYPDVAIMQYDILPDFESKLLYHARAGAHGRLSAHPLPEHSADVSEGLPFSAASPPPRAPHQGHCAGAHLPARPSSHAPPPSPAPSPSIPFLGIALTCRRASRWEQPHYPPPPPVPR